jgi:hypothetical protein
MNHLRTAFPCPREATARAPRVRTLPYPAPKVIHCVRGAASPLLANIYMNRFLKYWRLTGCGEALRAHVIAYADDFVILSRGCAAEALAWTKAVMTRLGLTLNEAKTSLKNARQERSMSGDGKRSAAAWPKLPRPSSTLPAQRGRRAGDAL